MGDTIIKARLGKTPGQSFLQQSKVLKFFRSYSYIWFKNYNVYEDLKFERGIWGY